MTTAAGTTAASDGGAQQARFTHVTMNNKLAIFRAMTGINTEHGLTILEGVNRPVSNVGIYTKVAQHEKQAGREYRFFRLLINTCLGLQLIVAAALTALGAGNGPRALVTAFGAINTVIAGVLTYIKGSGLPNRKRYYLNEWGQVRQYIEQRERDFCLEGCELDVEEEIVKVEGMYDEVMADIEANTPESYTGNQNAGGSPVLRNTTKPRPASAAAAAFGRDNDDATLGRNGTRKSFVKVPQKVEEQKSQS